MNRYPVKRSVALAVVSAFVVPLVAFCYAGLYAVDAAGMLSIFIPISTILSVLLPVLFLAITWGVIYMLRRLLRSLSAALPGMRTLGALWTLLAVSAGALSVLSPAYSMFPENTLVCVAWTIAFSVELVAGIAFGLVLVRFGFRGGNGLLLAMGIALTASFAFNYSGLRVAQTVIDKEIAAMNGNSGQLDENVIGTLFGISPSEYDTLDGESLADYQEISSIAAVVAVSLFAGLVVLYSSASVLFFSLAAVYFMRKNFPRPIARRGHPRQNDEREIVC